MTTFELLQRTYAILQSNEVFWVPDEVVMNGLNAAQRLLAVRNPSLVVQRTRLDLVAHEVLVDLRTVAPRAWRVERVALGDATVSTLPPITERRGDLRKTTLAALRSHRDWFMRTAAVPHAWYVHGMTWLGLYPRQTQALTVTLVSSALPMPLALNEPARESELPHVWHPVLPEVASALLQMKEGMGPELDQAMARLQGVIGMEPLARAQKELLAEKRRQMYGRVRATA